MRAFSRVLALIAGGLLAACGTAPQLSAGSGAPRPLAAKDQAPPPVLLVHGHGGSHVDFAAMSQALQQAGFHVYTLDFDPNTAPLLIEVIELAGRIRQVQRDSGSEHLDIVAHSMGGLVSRYYLKFMGGTRFVDHLVTVSTPNHGIFLARWGFDAGAKDLSPDSAVMQELNAGVMAPPPVRYTSIWSHLDYTEFYPWNSAKLPGATNISFWHGTHKSLLDEPKVQQIVEQALRVPQGAAPDDGVHDVSADHPDLPSDLFSAAQSGLQPGL